MGLSPGIRLGAYEITGLLGAGSMGEVYRARDTRLGREVAIKVLPAVAGDAERLARFTREAQVLASDARSPFLGLELVEGPTPADRIASDPLPLDEALLVAAQIAEALDAAHEAGIVHRDLRFRPGQEAQLVAVDVGVTGDTSKRARRAPSSRSVSFAAGRRKPITGSTMQWRRTGSASSSP